ncbi:MAG: hypothetical protein HKN67_07950, partial [Saprospiraceae bacterium]|nr:hypothetical protein [Saprospiraceae bacterium]
DNEFDYIIKEGSELRVQPPAESWNKLERKLKKARKNRKIQRKSGLRFIMSMAAVFIILIIAFSVIQDMGSNISEVQRGTIVEWEELDTNADFFHNVDQIRQLNTAYAKLFFERSPLDPVNSRNSPFQNPG